MPPSLTTSVHFWLLFLLVPTHNASLPPHTHSDRAATYVIDGQPMRGIFASDLTLAEVKTLRAKQRLEFRDHSHDGQYGIVTFEEFLDLALAAGRPVGVYPGSRGGSRRVAARGGLCSFFV